MKSDSRGYALGNQSRNASCGDLGKTWYKMQWHAQNRSEWRTEAYLCLCSEKSWEWEETSMMWVNAEVLKRGVMETEENTTHRIITRTEITTLKHGFTKNATDKLFSPFDVCIDFFDKYRLPTNDVGVFLMVLSPLWFSRVISNKACAVYTKCTEQREQTGGHTSR